ncbi:MAG: hypothetical protein EBU49_14815 [Proteobacteria bacterium]|nr:hypothetical protein [Pseudomonadota bacterium]
MGARLSWFVLLNLTIAAFVGCSAIKSKEKSTGQSDANPVQVNDSPMAGRNVVTVGENNVAAVVQYQKELEASVSKLIQERPATKLTPKEIRDRLAGLPETFGLASPDENAQVAYLVDDGAAVSKSLETVTIQAPPCIDCEPSQPPPAWAGVVVDWWFKLIEELNKDRPDPVVDPVAPAQPAVPAAPPPIVIVGGDVGGVDPKPLQPPQLCVQFGIGGRCCNVNNGAGALADVCTVYFRVPTARPGIFFFGSCQWTRGGGISGMSTIFTPICLTFFSSDSVGSDETYMVSFTLRKWQ